VRDVGKAFGLSPDVTAALAGSAWGWSEDGVQATALKALGLDPHDQRLQLTLELSNELMGFPRHLAASSSPVAGSTSCVRSKMRRWLTAR